MSKFNSLSKDNFEKIDVKSTRLLLMYLPTKDQVNETNRLLKELIGIIKVNQKIDGGK